MVSPTTTLATLDQQRYARGYVRRLLLSLFSAPASAAVLQPFLYVSLLTAARRPFPSALVLQSSAVVTDTGAIGGRVVGIVTTRDHERVASSRRLSPRLIFLIFLNHFNFPDPPTRGACTAGRSLHHRRVSHDDRRRHGPL